MPSGAAANAKAEALPKNKKEIRPADTRIIFSDTVGLIFYANVKLSYGGSFYKAGIKPAPIFQLAVRRRRTVLKE